MPVNLGEVPGYYRRIIDRVDVAVLKTCPMDADGYSNFSGTGGQLQFVRGAYASPRG